MLNRDQILAATAKPAGTLRVDEWGGEVGIRRLTVLEVEALQAAGEKQEDELKFLRYVAELALVDEQNRGLFGDDDNRLDHLGYGTLQGIGMALYEANYMTTDSRERLRKNSVAALTCNTG
jgi:hypothetical protein